MMRDQGIAANATPRALRGHSKEAERDCHYRTRRRGTSYVLREKVERASTELSKSGAIRDPARAKLAETRRVITTAGCERLYYSNSKGKPPSPARSDNS